MPLSNIFCLGVGLVAFGWSFGEYDGMHYVDSTIEPVPAFVIYTDIALLWARYSLFLVPIGIVLLAINVKLTRENKRVLLSRTVCQWALLWTGMVFSAIRYYFERQPYFPS